MELKNMNGFCELNENTMMEIDGGYRFASGSGSDSVSYNAGRALSVAGIGVAAVGYIATGPVGAVAFVAGVALSYVGGAIS